MGEMQLFPPWRMRSSPAKGWSAARPVAPPQGDQERVSLREKEKVREEKQEGGDEPEALSG